MLRLGIIAALLMIGVAQAAEPVNEDPCGVADPGCARRLARVLSGLHWGEPEFEGLLHWGADPTEVAGRFKASGLAAHSTGGDFEVLVFEILLAPNEQGVRVRFTAADSEVIYFCKDREDRQRAPGTGLFSDCQPTQWLGMGGSVVTFQADPLQNRWAARWAEMNVVLNLLANGNGIRSLRQKLLVEAGASIDTVRFGDVRGDEVGDSQFGTYVRGNFGVVGSLRSRGNRFEIEGYAGFRPNVVEWDDWGAEARVKLVTHLLTSRDTVVDLGGVLSLNHWTQPWRSVGPYASLTDERTAYVGLIFGVTFR